MSFMAYEKSLELLDSLEVGSVRVENIALNSAVGRVLAQDIVAKENDPKFPTASMDGYAVKFEDLEKKVLQVLDSDNPAGKDEQRVLKSGEAIKTFTGSKMPEGSDTLIQIENVTYKDSMITIDESVNFASSVRPIGEGYSTGDVLIKKGTKIGFAQVGVMAGLNIAMVQVVLRPRVAILATGSEIVDLGECSTNPAQIRSSNNYTLAALFEQAGAEVVQLGVVKDDKDSIMQTFQNALRSADIVVSTGGVSVGDYDFVKDIVPALGADVIFKGVGIKPGRHIMVAQKDERFVLGLPGFAYSSTVTSILYVLPLIAKMLGKESAYRTIEATLSEDFTKRSRFTEFTTVNLNLVDGEYFVDMQGKKVGSSAILTNMLDNSALMQTPQEKAFTPKGSKVEIIVLENF
jgi:molybdopterin molybdotransferase